MAGKYAQGNAYQTSEITNSKTAEFEKCLAPGVLLGCGHYACSHHAHGYGPQPVTTVLDPDTEQESESHVNKPVAVRARMTDAEILATIDRVRSLYIEHIMS